MVKPTKRKAFSFLRSYFDALNEIPEDKDKFTFLMSVINKQFLDENPSNLNLITKLSYEGQRHAIEKSVKGYKDKTKTKLNGKPLESDSYTPTQDPCQGGAQGGCQDPIQGPCQQEKEKEKEKEKHSIGKIEGDFFKPNKIFLKSVCKNFSQTTEILEMRVNSFLIRLHTQNKYKQFQKQVKAYVEYKKLSKERMHNWNGFTADWETVNWVDKLNKEKNIKEPNTNTKPKTFERYG